LGRYSEIISSLAALEIDLSHFLRGLVMQRNTAKIISKYMCVGRVPSRAVFRRSRWHPAVSHRIPAFVEAELNYLRRRRASPEPTRMSRRPESRRHGTAGAGDWCRFSTGDRGADVFSGSGRFTLVRRSTVVKNFYDDDEIIRRYYPESEAVIATALAADRVFIFDHTVRKRSKALPTCAAGPRQRRHGCTSIKPKQHRGRTGSEHLPTRPTSC